MAKITKLGQTFVAGTEATAVSQNAQNAKIDEIIDNFTLGDSTVALPITKSGTSYKITSIGSGLSVSNNVLNGYTLPAATTSSLGGVKVGDGLSIGVSGSTAGVLKVEYDDTLKMTDGVLGVANPQGGGGVTMDDVNNAISTALSLYVKKSDASLSIVGGSGKYIQSVSQSNGKISATAVSMPSLISSNLMYFSKATKGDYLIANALVQVVDFENNVATIEVTSSHKTIGLLLPTDTDSFTFKDSQSQNITGELVFVGSIVRSGKLYNLFYMTGDGNLTGTYTLTKNS